MDLFKMKYYLLYLLLLIIDFTYCTDDARFRCDYTYSEYSKAWYKYHAVPATWRDARLMCIFEGSILASPTTMKIRATIIKSLGNIPIYTGFHSTISKGKYYTIDGIPLDDTYHTWAKFEPNNIHDNENCLTLNSLGQLSDVNCEEPHPYICYRDAIEEINECGTYDSEYTLDTRTNHCYKFHAVPRTFERAQLACSAEGGHLAIVNNDDEVKVLRDLFDRYPKEKMIGEFWKNTAFIGFYSWGENGDWRTIHGQTLLEAGYEVWFPGEPNNSSTGEFCGSIYRTTATLNDLYCASEYAFICEKRPDYPPVCDIDASPQLDKKMKTIEMISRQNLLSG